MQDDRRAAELADVNCLWLHREIIRKFAKQRDKVPHELKYRGAELNRGSVGRSERNDLSN